MDGMSQSVRQVLLNESDAQQEKQLAEAQARFYRSKNRGKVYVPPLARAKDRTGRNELCPCGSGYKAKKCVRYRHQYVNPDGKLGAFQQLMGVTPAAAPDKAEELT